MGFEVIESASGDDAMDYIASGERIDVLITDIQTAGPQPARTPARRLSPERVRSGLFDANEHAPGAGQRGAGKDDQRVVAKRTSIGAQGDAKRADLVMARGVEQ